MHFIEDLFGLSPDGGSGWTEFVIFLALMAVILMGLLLRATRQHPKPK